MTKSRSSSASVGGPERTSGASTRDSVSRGDAFLLAVVERLARLGSLTPRMLEALALHVGGWPRGLAADEMGCAENTYRNHLASALRRIGADAPSELFRVLARDLDADHEDRSAEATKSDRDARPELVRLIIATARHPA